MRIPFQSLRPYAAGFGVVVLIQTMSFVRGSVGRAGLQPIAFNHSKHINAGLGCTDCHAGVQAEEHATIPSISVCIGCHESALTNSPEEAKLRAYGTSGKEPPWRPVTHVPRHVYFSHRRHVTLAKLECTTCHGSMEKLTAPPSKPLVAIAMDSCIECHQKKQARTDCNDCHR